VRSLILILFLAIFSLPALAEGPTCDMPKSLSDRVRQFRKMIWEPNYEDSCKEDSVAKNCIPYVEKLKADGKNWRTYLGSCGASQSALKYPLSCTKVIEDIGISIAESYRVGQERYEADVECSKNQDNKVFIIAQYNQNKPKALQILDTKVTQNLMSKTCQELEAFLQGYLRNRMVLMAQMTPFYLDDSGLTDYQKEYIAWKNKLTQPYQEGGKFWEQLQAELKKSMNEFECMSPYRKTELTCEVLVDLFATRSLVIASRTQKVSKSRKILEIDEINNPIAKSTDSMEFKAEEFVLGYESRRANVALAKNNRGVSRNPDLLKKIDEIEAGFQKEYYEDLSKKIKPGQGIKFYYDKKLITAPIADVTEKGIVIQKADGLTGPVVVPFDADYLVFGK
jgi:hypothetical protein